jgi:calcium uptake protein 3, mitochondrial
LFSLSDRPGGSFVQLERIFSHAYRDRRGLLRPKSTDGDEKDEDEKKQTESAATKKIKYQEQEALNALDEGLQRRHEIDTTLLVHLFGKSGTRELTYEQFSAFMENLQTEVLEMEFLEFSKGLATITELDFAKILLRYTQLEPDT